MNGLNNLRIGFRLGVGFALLIACSLAIAVYARIALGSVNQEFHLLTDDRIVKVEQLVEMTNNLNLIAISVRTIALTGEESVMADEARHI